MRPDHAMRVNQHEEWGSVSLVDATLQGSPRASTGCGAWSPSWCRRWGTGLAQRQVDVQREAGAGGGNRCPKGCFSLCPGSTSEKRTHTGLDHRALQTTDRLRCPNYEFHNVQLCVFDITSAFLLLNKTPVSLFLFSHLMLFILITICLLFILISILIFIFEIYVNILIFKITCSLVYLITV